MIVYVNTPELLNPPSDVLTTQQVCIRELTDDVSVPETDNLSINNAFFININSDLYIETLDVLNVDTPVLTRSLQETFVTTDTPCSQWPATVYFKYRNDTVATASFIGLGQIDTKVNCQFLYGETFKANAVFTIPQTFDTVVTVNLGSFKKDFAAQANFYNTGNKSFPGHIVIQRGRKHQVKH